MLQSSPSLNLALISRYPVLEFALLPNSLLFASKSMFLTSLPNISDINLLVICAFFEFPNSS